MFVGEDALSVWSLSDGRLLHSDKRSSRAVCFSPDSCWLLTASEGYEVWSTSNWRRAHVLNAPDFSNQNTQAIFHPSKPLLIAGGSLGRIFIWSTRNWELIGVLENPNQLPVRRLSFDAPGRKLHFASKSGVFATWDFERLSEGLRTQGLDW